MPDQDERIGKLATPEECERFAINVEVRGKRELALAARRRAIELRAVAHGASSEAEREALEAVYAYERVLSAKAHKKVKATRTWQMIARHGIIKSIKLVVRRPTDATGYTALAEMGIEDMSFEAVVLRHPEIFSAEAVERSRERLQG